MPSRLALLPVLIAAAFCVAPRLQAAPIQVDVPQVPVLPVVDGVIDDLPLQRACQIDLVRIGSMDRPENLTTVSVLVSREGAYFAFRCLDADAAGIISRVQRVNGPVFEDDSVQVFLSPFMEVSSSNYIHLAVNSAGVVYSNNMETDRPVEGWTAATRVTPMGWDAEIFVPIRAFGADLRVSRIWRGNLARVRSARPGQAVERTAWVDPGVSLHNYRRFGFMRILEMTGGAESASPAQRPVAAPALTSILDSPLPQLVAPAPALVPVEAPRPLTTTRNDRSVVVESLPAAARLEATREIMLATGKDLESVRLLLTRLPATVATDLSEEQANRLRERLASVGADVFIR